MVLIRRLKDEFDAVDDVEDDDALLVPDRVLLFRARMGFTGASPVANAGLGGEWRGTGG